MFVELKKWYEMGNLFFLEDTDILGESLLKSGFKFIFLLYLWFRMAGYNLQRFLDAQQGIYEQALAEVKDGKKYSHWIWYIFPQLKGLGMSYNSQYYGTAVKRRPKHILLIPY